MGSFQTNLITQHEEEDIVYVFVRLDLPETRALAVTKAWSLFPRKQICTCMKVHNSSEVCMSSPPGVKFAPRDDLGPQR
jgi:hypothetical protein